MLVVSAITATFSAAANCLEIGAEAEYGVEILNVQQMAHLL